MKIWLTFSLIIILILLTSLMIVESASAEMEKPTWEIGDYWNYDVTWYEDNTIITGTSKITVKEEKTITVNETDYNVLMCILNINLKSDSFADELIIDSIGYFRLSDYARVKDITDSPQIGHYEYTYNPPVPFQWPINVGNTWQKKTIETVYNGTATITNEINRSYECIQETEVTVPAGIFNCYVVINWDGEYSSKNQTISYYSPEVGNYAKRHMYQNGILVRSLDLTSFKDSSSSKDDSNKNDKTPGFELVIIAIAIGLLLLYKRKKK